VKSVDFFKPGDLVRPLRGTKIYLVLSVEKFKVFGELSEGVLELKFIDNDCDVSTVVYGIKNGQFYSSFTKVK